MIRTIARAFFPDKVTVEAVQGPFVKAGEFDPSWLIEAEQLVHLDFDRVLDRAGSFTSPEQRSRFLTRVVLEWLHRNSARIDSDYRLVRTRHFAVLAPAGFETGVAKYCQKTRGEIKNILSRIVTDDLSYPVAILAFDSSEPYYYSHKSYYIGDELTDTAASGGVFYGSPSNHHISIQVDFTSKNFSFHAIIAHELCHCMMAHLDLPAWLDEGITQMVEESVAGSPYVETLTLREMTDRNRECWTPENIQSFWTGVSFYIEETQEMSYYFAKVLVNLIKDEICNSNEEFAEFVTSAKNYDAGEGAFRRIFGESLGVLVEEILGGESSAWAPEPALW